MLSSDTAAYDEYADRTAPDACPARKFASREAALAFKAEHNISNAFYPEVY